MKLFSLFLLASLTEGFKTPSTLVRSSSQLFMNNNPSDIIREVTRGGIGNEWTYNEFINNLKDHNIDQVSILSDQKAFAAIDTQHTDVVSPDNIHLIKTLPHMIDDLLPKLYTNHINFDILKLPESGGGIPGPLQFIGMYLIGSLVINFVLAFIRRGGMSTGNPLENNMMNPFSKKSNEVDVNKVETKFEDVAGCDEAKFELMEVVDFLKNPQKYKEAGAKVPKGVLLEGDPGTGKTLMARAVAGEAGVSFLSASGSEFIEMYVGLGASRVRKLFEEAKKNSPCVIFIDEIDAIGRQRGAGINTGNDEREQTLNQILTNMDGFEESEGIIVLAATNRADILDSALLRPGRFDRKVKVPLPDIDGRKEIFKVHTKNKNIAKEVNIDELAVLTSGFSGAEICNLANEAAILSVRRNSTIIDRQALLDAYEKMTIGLPALKNTKDKDILSLVAYHEIGHALMVKYFEEFFDLRKVTINANKGGAGGYTLFTPKERFINYPTKKFMLANLVIALGGRAAEVVLYENNKKKSTDVVFKGVDNLDITTGASNDLKQADNIARKYISLFGLTETGSSNSPSNTQPFLGRQLGMGGDPTSEYSKANVDKKVSELIKSSYNIALNLIRSNPEDFNKLASNLLDKKTIDIDDFKDVELLYH